MPLNLFSLPKRAARIFFAVGLLTTSSTPAKSEDSAIYYAGADQWKRHPEAVVPFVSRAPEVDGTIDPKEWAGALELGPLKSQPEGVIDEYERRVWMSYDDRNVYLAFRLERPRIAPIPGSPEKTGRLEVGSSGPSSDVAEVLFAPGLNFNRSFSFWMYGNAAFGDALCDRGKKLGHNPEWRRAAKMTGSGWQGEMAIPFAAFERSGPPSPEEWWGFDFVDNRKTPSLLLAQWSLRTVWHTYENFGRIRFGKVPAVRFLRAGESDGGRVGVALEVANETGAPEKVRVTTELLRRKDGEEGGPSSYFANIDSGVSEDAQAEFDKNATLKGMIQFAETFYVPVAKEPKAEVREVPAGGSVIFENSENVPHGEYLARYRVEDSTGRALAAGASVFRNEPPLALRIEPYWLYAQIINTFVDLRKTGLDGKGVLTLEVLPADGKGTALKMQTKDVSAAEPLATAALGIEGLEAGSYLLRASLSGTDGRRLAENTLAFTRPEFPEWYKNDFGNKTPVPTPWTPVRAGADGKVEVWGRTYDLSKIFPAAVTSRGLEVLAAPVQLTTKTAAGEVSWKVERLELKDQTPGAALYEVGQSGGGLRLTGTMRIEFDGLVWYELQLSPEGAPVEISSVVLDVPVNAALSELMDRHSYLSDPLLDKGKSPAPEQGGQPGLLTDSRMPFTPYLWIGNERAGIGLVAEAPIDWSVARSTGLMETRAPSNGGPGRILANIVQKPITLEKSMRLSFGLQATPIRETPKDRSVLNIYQRNGPIDDEKVFKEVADKGGKVFVFYYAWRGNSMTELGGTPEPPVDPAQTELLKRGIALAHKYGLKAILYTGWGVNATSPNWKKYSYELGKYPIVNKGWGTFEQSASPQGGYVDFMAWGHAHIAKEYGADGVLWDSAAQVPLDANLPTGNAWVDAAGNVRPKFPVLATRDLFRRVYNIYNGEAGKDGIIYNHAGSMWPVNVFSTMLNRGEGRPMTAKTLRESWIPFEEFRAAYSGTPYGTLYSGEVNDWEKLPMRVSTHLAVTLLHGNYAKEYALMPEATYRSYGYETRPLLQLWETFNWLPMDGEETRHYYYENLEGPYQAVKATPASLLSSAFVSGDKKRAIIVVSNLDTTPVNSAKIEIDPASLGLPADKPLKFQDGVTLENLTSRGNTLSLDIDQQRYRVVKVSLE